jgi:hypothetical protein
MANELDLVWIQTPAGPKRVWRTRQECRQGRLRRLSLWVERTLIANIAVAAFLWKFCKRTQPHPNRPQDRASA